MSSISVTVTNGSNPPITKTATVSDSDMARFMSWLTTRNQHQNSAGMVAPFRGGVTAIPLTTLQADVSPEGAVGQWFQEWLNQSMNQQHNSEREAAVRSLPASIAVAMDME